ncbi:MAG: ABC transporter permease, partial [Alphaproteobacteria bacterium]
ACLTLGVAAIAAIGSFSAAVNRGLERDARILLGGDVDVRLMHRPATEAQRNHLAAGGTVSAVAEMRAMARASRAGGDKANRRVLVELKSVDERYPLVGAVTLTPAMVLDAALAPADHASEHGSDRVFGAVAERELLARLGLAVGDRVRVGAAELVIRAVLEREPDRASGPFRLGPRMMINAGALAATGLVRPGSLHHYHYRVKLAPGTDPGAWTAALSKAFPDAGWRLRTAENAAPGLRRFVERLKLLLTLIGLTALLVGGIGVGNAVKSYLDGKTATIATLKCLGAPSELIFRTYLIQIMAMALAGITLGLLIGAALPALIVGAFAAYLPAAPRFDLYPLPLALAGAYGVLTALSFALWPLARAREVSAAGLFRDLVSPVRRWPRPAHIAATLCAATALALLAYLAATESRFALWFIAGAIATLLMFRFASGALRWAARRLGAAPATRRRLPLLRLALLNLHRPGSPAGIIILSLGTALTVFIALTQIEGNLQRQIREKIPDRAPSYYFID